MHTSISELLFLMIIVDTLEIISEDYHVGLGSFIDKLTYPYVSDHQLKLVVNHFVQCKS